MHHFRCGRNSAKRCLQSAAGIPPNALRHPRIVLGAHTPACTGPKPTRHTQPKSRSQKSPPHPQNSANRYFGNASVKFNHENLSGGLADRGLARKAPSGPKSPFGVISALPLWLCGGFGTDRPRQDPNRPWKGQINPEKVRFSQADFPPIPLKIWGLSPVCEPPFRSFSKFKHSP